MRWLALIALVIATPLSAQAIPQHDAPRLEDVAAQTSPRVEALRSATNAYIGAALAFERAFDAGRIAEHQYHIEDRAYDGLQYLASLKDADEVTFTAALYYVNNAIDELYAISKEPEHDAHAH